MLTTQNGLRLLQRPFGFKTKEMAATVNLFQKFFGSNNIPTDDQFLKYPGAVIEWIDNGGDSYTKRYSIEGNSSDAPEDPFSITLCVVEYTGYVPSTGAFTLAINTHNTLLT